MINLKETGQFEIECKALTEIILSAVAVESVTGRAESHRGYTVEASDWDIDRQFQEAGRALGNGLHQEYRRAHAERDGIQVKLELIIVARSATAFDRLERRSKEAFNGLYDRYRRKTGSLNEQQRMCYERLRSASTSPEPLEWRIQETIDFRRDPKDPEWKNHLFVEDDGAFRTSMGTWETGVLAEELADKATIAWLRNLDRKPWSMEIPYEEAGKVKPMFPDMLIVRKDKSGFIFDLLEPHNPSLNDNVDKAKGLAKFADRHGHLFGRIQLIRGSDTGDGKQKKFRRIDLNKTSVRERVRTVTSDKQLDQIFDSNGEFRS